MPPKRTFPLIGSVAVLAVTAFGWSATAVSGQPSDAPQEPQAGEAAFEALIAELEQTRQAWVREYREATTDAERTNLEKNSPLRIFEPRFLDLARTYVGQPTAMQAVHWLAETANPGPVYDEGLALIERHHLEDKGIEKLCRTLVFRRSPGIEAFLLAVAKNHPDRSIRGLGYYSLARYLKNLHDFAVGVKENPDWLGKVKPHFSEDIIAWFSAADPAELSARVDVLCEKISREFADLSDDEYVESVGEMRTLADAAKALSFSLDPIGKVAPETVGKGVDGSPVSLTDFRGKLTVLMFSANWCVPCKEMYGQLRELMKLYADKPFTVMTVMADKEISTVRKAVDAGEITWPVIWDGDNGPIARGWNITAYPTIYLINQDGRIRHQGLRDDSLDDEVARMLGVDPESRVKVDKRTRVWELSFRKMGISEEELPDLLTGYTELRKLDLSYNPLSDQAITHLQHLKRLEIVNLEHTGIGDKGLWGLKDLHNLKEVHLYLGPGHHTTKDGRRQLRTAIPGLRMSFITH